MVKYQIFISSTYDDLKNERAQVIKSILEMGHIPVGMEMFSAADDEQWKIIQRQIDESDYYVVVVAHKYGSMVGDISYTEKEFDYAVSKGVPVLGFVIDPTVEPLAKYVEKNDDKIVLLNNFKDKVKNRPVGFWKSSDDLHGKVSIALMKAFNTNPRIGWARATSVAGPEVVAELSRLSKENSDLREQLRLLDSNKETKQQEEFVKLKDMMSSVEMKMPLRLKGDADWNISADTTLYKIYSILASEITIEISVERAATYVGRTSNPDKTKELSDVAPYPLNRMRDCFLSLSALELVEPSKKKHPVSDVNEYWSLSCHGLAFLKFMKLNALKDMANKKTKEPDV